MANLAPTQVEQLQSIGAYLRQVRQEQGVSLEVLASQIFIRPALLQAMETGRSEQLPEPVFIQGFIRRYAEALGLDGKAISQEFKVNPVEVLPTPELVTPVPGNGVRSPEPELRPEPRPEIHPVEKPQYAPYTTSPRRSALPLWLGLGAAILALGAGVWALVGRNPAPSTAEDPPEITTELPSATDPLAEPPQSAAPLEPIEPETQPTLEAPIVVTASLSDRAWLSVVADGENVYEGTPEDGYEETWTAQDSLVFRTGNAGGVSLSINGDEPVVLGESGVVKTLTLTPNSNAETVQAAE
ncbi:MAG: helix-turn-helix domain-containing protein [Leptolyngbyaceae cyanobacterium SM2_5_2]|nr:helix-turn-helix domain-containing protein [Leptolyngbyaceae cyanobacterium SM2_5_2]